MASLGGKTHLTVSLNYQRIQAEKLVFFQFMFSVDLLCVRHRAE